MKKLKQHLITTFFLYSVFYAIKTFVLFEFTNPFWWIIDLPTYSNYLRACIILGLLAIQIITATIRDVFLFRNKLD